MKARITFKALDAEEVETKEEVKELGQTEVIKAILDIVKTNDNEATSLLLKYRAQETAKADERTKAKAAQQDAMKALTPTIELFNNELVKLVKYFRDDKSAVNKDEVNLKKLAMDQIKPGAIDASASPIFKFGRDAETKDTLSSMGSKYESFCKQTFSTLKGIEGAIDVKAESNMVVIKIRKDLLAQSLYDIYKKKLK